MFNVQSICSALGGIPGEALTGIIGEIELLRGLNHPNIVKYIGSFKTRSHLYIIMEVRPQASFALATRLPAISICTALGCQLALAASGTHTRSTPQSADVPDGTAQFMENGALSNIIKPSRFGCFPEPLVAMYISQVRTIAPAGPPCQQASARVHYLREFTGFCVLTSEPMHL